MNGTEPVSNASQDEGEDLTQERSRLAAWNETFLRLRRLTKGHQLLCLWVVVVSLLQWDGGLQLMLSLSTASTSGETDTGMAGEEGYRTLEALGKILASGALAEILMWLGHFWLIKPGRQLPTWPATVPGCYSLNRLLNRWGNWNLDWPFLNNALAVGLCCCTGLCLLIDSLNRPLLLTTLVLYSVLCSIDRWRFLYSTYWIAGFLALLEPSTTALSLHIVFGSLYFWAGFFKLTCLAFYSSTAPIVFEPVYTILAKLRLQQQWLRNAVAGIAVGLEMIMGLLILGTPFISPTDGFLFLDWRILKGSILFINHGMHLYIITLIGYRNRVETFVSWNAMCAAVVALLYRGDGFQSVSINPQPGQPQVGVLQVALFLLMWIPPLLQLFGRNPYPTLSHSWFVPGCGGLSTLIVPQQGYHNFPRSDNGVYIRGFRDPALIAKATRLAGGKESLLKGMSLPSTGKGRRKGDEAGTESQRTQPTAETDLATLVCLGGEWVDNTFRLYVDRHDDCNEHFGAGPKSFWQRIVTTTVRMPCLLLLEQRHGVLGLPGLPDEVCFLYPEE